jgi:hypothetical protein
LWSSGERIGNNARETERIYKIDFMHRIQELLGIADYTIYTEKVSKDQVSAEDGNKEFVGICVNWEKRIGFLYHTRELTDEDVVHELIHLAYPTFTEEEVNVATARLLKAIG